MRVCTKINSWVILAPVCGADCQHPLKMDGMLQLLVIYTLSDRKRTLSFAGKVGPMLKDWYLCGNIVSVLSLCRYWIYLYTIRDTRVG